MSSSYVSCVCSYGLSIIYRGLCRGVADDAACWHGLRAQEENQWGWEEDFTMLDTTFRNWQWHEPNNRTHPDG